jgi:hypothetical protein
MKSWVAGYFDKTARIVARRICGGDYGARPSGRFNVRRSPPLEKSLARFDPTGEAA